MKRKYKRWHYRKVSPADLEIMKKLKEAGFTYKEICEKFKICINTLIYHLDPQTKKQSIKRSLKFWNNLSQKEKIKRSRKHQKYKSNYLIERYQNDKEFHDRFLNNVRNSQHRIRKERINKSLCVDCGKRLSDKRYKSCYNCRLKNSVLSHNLNIKRSKLGFCTNCGKKKSNPNFKSCDNCREKTRNNRNNWVKTGRCYSCGRKNDREGLRCCSRCKEKSYFYQKKYLLKKGKKTLNT